MQDDEEDKGEMEVDESRRRRERSSILVGRQDRRLGAKLAWKEEGKKRKTKGKERASSSYSPPSLSPETYGGGLLEPE